MWKTFVFWVKYFQSLVIFMFVFYQKPVTSITQTWLVREMIGQRNDWSEKWLVREMIGQRKLPDSSMNNIFNVLSIGLHCTLSFKRPDFGLKCLVTTTPKVQSLKFKSMYKWNRRIVPHFLNLLIVIELLLWNRKERQNAVDYVLFKAFRVLAGIVLYL